MHPNTNHVAITRRAKKFGWTRDLAAKIKAKADDLVTRQVVTVLETAERAVTERTVIEANAYQIAQVRNEHRSDIRRFRKLVTTQLGELEALADQPELFQKLGELMGSAEDGAGNLPGMEAAYRKVIDIPMRIDGVKKLAETMKHLIGLEREAYDISAPTQKVELNAKVEGSRKVHELSDDELFAIATGGSAGTADPSQGTH